MYPMDYVYYFSIALNKKLLLLWINLYGVEGDYLTELMHRTPKPVDIKKLRGDKYIVKYELDDDTLSRLMGVLS